MLALIGLKKFRRFQKPNRIARTVDAFYGRRDTKQGVSGPARVAGSVAELRESGGRLRSRFGDPEAKKRTMEKAGSECNFGEQLATRL